MKPLSEYLAELAARAKKVEESADATREKNREKLEARRQEIEGAFDRQAEKIQTTATEAGKKVQGWWTDAKASVDRQVGAMRADFGELKKAIEVDQAQMAADEAEVEAEASIEMATYWLEAAEYSVIQATLARAEADSMVAAR